VGFAFHAITKEESAHAEKNISPGNELGRNDCCDATHVPEHFFKRNWPQRS
jgi:hypothetical protein